MMNDIYDEYNQEPLPLLDDYEDAIKASPLDIDVDDKGVPRSDFESILKLEFDFDKVGSSSNEGANESIRAGKRAIECYLKIINQLAETNDNAEYGFRGSSDAIKYKFEPSLNREENLKGGKPQEKDYYHHAIRLAPEEFSNMNPFDVLCKMQHYGLPTRLLDLTANPLVALWFACNGSKEKDKLPGKVEIVKGKFYQSDLHEIQIICLIGDFLSRHLDAMADNKLSYVHFRDYLNKKKMWCGGDDFLGYLQTVVRLQCIGIRPDYSNPRLKAQQGLFMLFGMGYAEKSNEPSYRFPFDAPFPSVFSTNIHKIIISPGAKAVIRAQLIKIGFDKSRIYPELEHIAEYVKNDLVNNKNGVCP